MPSYQSILEHFPEVQCISGVDQLSSPVAQPIPAQCIRAPSAQCISPAECISQWRAPYWFPYIQEDIQESILHRLVPKHTRRHRLLTWSTNIEYQHRLFS
uniref:Uncharacterized protein n=2 Tax=Picea TaxID=3328 RepID=A0A101LTR0_PICGL|nr:hypothetical protein ABT39_MTgene3595 [Picea glauca]KUM47805.1 hypothetical protein ABT39_MTgene4799 [Picea glauca]KUM47812.1 hypothetical protein ABT39_MTgene4806 [Picea glauca]QHR91689.1 hypothetical protein Q903MT_gene5725 [Picea sitchensis]